MARRAARGTVEDTTPVDLRPPPVDPWDELAIPRGWAPIGRLARRMITDLEPLTERIVDRIVEELPEYREGGVPREDLASSVRRNVEMILIGLAEHRGPREHEVVVRGGLGSRRALQGVSAEMVIQAFHVGYRELWRAMVDAVPAGDQRTATLLLTAATTVWSWVHEVTEALAASHAATVRSIEARVVGARQRFVELLVGAAGADDGGASAGRGRDAGDSEVARLGRSLGFDPVGSFFAVAVRGVSDDLDAVGVQRRLDTVEGQHAAVARGPLVLVVSQSSAAEPIVDACRAIFPAAAIALGALRPGLAGASGSLVDAELTLAVTADHAIASFEAAWLWATLTAAAGRLRPLLVAGADVAARHPHLTDAVTAFADASFSVTEAARSLEVHANTVSYRLDRWAELTGWDPRSYEGLSRSLASLRLPS